jgi:hypothetical protein
MEAVGSFLTHLVRRRFQIANVSIINDYTSILLVFLATTVAS